MGKCNGRDGGRLAGSAFPMRIRDRNNDETNVKIALSRQRGEKGAHASHTFLCHVFERRLQIASSMFCASLDLSFAIRATYSGHDIDMVWGFLLTLAQIVLQILRIEENKPHVISKVYFLIDDATFLSLSLQ